MNTHVELPDSIRVPLDELHADAAYLFGRVAADGSVAGAMTEAVRSKLSELKTAIVSRIASPAAPQVVTDDEIDAAVDAFDNVYDGVSHNKREAIAAALLARRPAQGVSLAGVTVKDKGFLPPRWVDGNAIYTPTITLGFAENDWAARDKFFDVIHAHAKGHVTAPPAAPAGASTHAAWPTRDELREVAREAYRTWPIDGDDHRASFIAVADAIHTKYFAGGRDGEGS